MKEELSKVQTTISKEKEPLNRELSQLEEKHERLESLYEVTSLVSRALTLDELAGASGVATPLSRWPPKNLKTCRRKFRGRAFGWMSRSDCESRLYALV